MDVLFDINIVLDVLSCRRPGHKGSVSVLQHLATQGARRWVYSGSVQTLQYLAMGELRAENLPLSSRGRFTLARQLLDRALAEFQWLAALAGEGNGIFTEPDPEDAQLIRAVARLGPDARLLTRDEQLLASCPQAISPSDFLALDLPAPKIDFLDLKTQQDQLRPQIEAGIHRVLHHGQYILGPEIAELETRLADYVGVRHCITVSSGTDSLLIAMMALGIGAGDEVITVPYTWISTAEMIALLGARPVFIDVDPRTYNMNPELLEAAITGRTRAIMPVSIYGQCADMDAICAIAEKHGLPVIEDAAQSFGATYNGRKSCALSTIGSTSFFPTKPLGCYGDGGALFTGDDELADRMRQIRVHGQKKKHHHPVIGINGRFDTIQAAVVLAKLDTFDDEMRHRTEVGARYTELLAGAASSGSSPEIIPPFIAPGNTSVYAQYTIQCADRDSVAEKLASRNIPSVAYYAVPLHLQPAFANLSHQLGDFPEAERIAAHGLSLPMSAWLPSAIQSEIIGALRPIES